MGLKPQKDSVQLIANGWGMPVLPQHISAGLMAAALDGRETNQLETKRVSGKMVAKALETVCAFANTIGGWLILGMDDAGKAQGQQRLYGIDENPEAIDELLRKLSSHLQPPVERVRPWFFPTTLRDGAHGQLVVLQIPPSDKVHSLLEGGTWMRLQASNRQMSATEITELSFQRGTRSAETQTMAVDFDLLDTVTWQRYVRARGLSSTGIADQMYRIGLAQHVQNQLRPLRAAVLLFADQPGALLAASGTRADVRVFHYKGMAMQLGEAPNLKKPPKTLSGPLHELITATHAYVLDELAQGLTMAASGFQTVHRYPQRVIKEAITNALIHRDYRLNRDIHIRIFDNRIEVESPGVFPSRITAATVQRAGSFARNGLIATCLRDFPEPPNVDAGEGVPMMFNLMRVENLYPPQYRELRREGQEAVVLTLFNEARPPIWEQVSDWMDRNGAISNNGLCQLSGFDTLKASKQLQRWVLQGLLISDTSRGKRNTTYRKPSQSGTEDLLAPLSGSLDNEPANSLKDL